MRKMKHIDLERHYFDRPLGLLLIIGYKTLWGLSEIATGTAFLFSYRFLTGELLEDPQDLLANWFLTHLTKPQTITLGEVFLALGVIKLILAVALWFRLKYIRLLGLLFFGSVGAFGLTHLAFHFSWQTLVGLLLDLGALLYFWRILPNHLTKKMIYE